MVGMLVRPALPVADRHASKESVIRFECLGPRGRETPSRCEHTFAVGRELRRTSPGGTRVVRGIRLPSVRPVDWRPETKPLHEWPATSRHRSIPRSNAEDHLPGVTEVAQHLVRRQRPPAALTARGEASESLRQRPDDSRIGDGLQSKGYGVNIGSSLPPFSAFRWVRGARSRETPPPTCGRRLAPS